MSTNRPAPRRAAQPEATSRPSDEPAHRTRAGSAALMAAMAASTNGPGRKTAASGRLGHVDAIGAVLAGDGRKRAGLGSDDDHADRSTSRAGKGARLGDAFKGDVGELTVLGLGYNEDAALIAHW